MEWIKEQLAKPRTYIILFVVSLVIPFIINGLYKFGEEWEYAYITLWGAKDVLSFFGDYLSFFGTIILGAVAVFQTDKANKQTGIANNISTDALEQAKQSNQIAKEALVQTKRANDLAVEMQKLERAKFVSLVSMERLITSKRGIGASAYYNPEMTSIEIISLVSSHYRKSDKYYHVDIRFKNDSDFPILHISADAWDRNNNKALDYGIQPNEKAIYIPPKQELCIRFLIPTRAFIDYKVFGISMQFSFTNVYDYTSVATLTIEDLEVNGVNKDYTYQLGKITDANPASHADSNKKEDDD